MVSTSIRCAPAFRRAALGCVLIVALSPVTGCDRSVEGTVAADAPAPVAVPGPPKTLAELLIEPGRFPPRYPATVLDPVAVAQAVADIDGVPPGAAVDPTRCAPVLPGPSPRDAVAVRGVDTDTSSSLTVTLTRANGPLAQRRDQLTSCSSFTATVGEQIDSVTVAVLPAPPVDADDTLAADQTVEGADGQTYRLTVLTGQVADTRITAAWTTSGEDDSDNDNSDNDDSSTEPLDRLFTDAVLKVRRDAR